MNDTLDLDDVCHGHPVAQQELESLRAQVEIAWNAMQSVLCDPEGNPCFRGSPGDHQVIAEALAALSSPNVVAKIKAEALREASARLFSAFGYQENMDLQRARTFLHSMADELEKEKQG